MKLHANLAAALLAVCAMVAPSAPWAAEPGKPTSAASSRQLASLCNECRLVHSVTADQRKGKASGVGIAGGAVVGGVVGSKVGDSTMATVGGAVLGGVLGNEAEKRIKRHTVWVVTTTARDGSRHKNEFDHDPQLKAGDVVVPEGSGLKRR